MTYEGLTLTELSQRVSLSKSTVLRLLNTLIQCGYIRKDQDSYRYRLGFKVLTLSMEFQKALEWKKEAFPHMKMLQQCTGETINLAVIDNTEVVYIERIESNQIMRASIRVGKRVPIHCTALGKAILAHMDTEDIQQIVEEIQFEPYTVNTINNRAEFMHCLEQVRRDGYAVDDEENQIGVRCVAAPVLNMVNHVIGAISISGPTLRISNEYLVELGQKVRGTGKSISLSIGWRAENNNFGG